jgi:hypothetical protein
MIRKFTAFCILLSLLTAGAMAQSAPADPLTALTAPAPKALTNAAIVDMVKGGFSEDLLIKAIRHMETSFDLSPRALLEMKNAGVSEPILLAMLSPREAELEAKSLVTTTALIPDDIGLYLVRDGELQEVAAELLTWRSGGVVKSMFLGTKGHINGALKGAHSKLTLAPPVSFVIRLRESEDISDFQFLRLDVKKDQREFRALTGGYFHSSGGFEKNAVEIEWKKIAPRTYRLSIARLGKGEYGLLPPGGEYGAVGGGASGSVIMQGKATSGKLYTFSVVE